MDNKKIGNEFEMRCCELLRQHKYWCHLFAYNTSGQPCDVIAINASKTILIDVKHANLNTFYLGRIEPNQHTCFEYALKCGVQYAGFAIWFDNDREFKWLSYEDAQGDLELGFRSVNRKDLITFEEFLKE